MANTQGRHRARSAGVVSGVLGTAGVALAGAVLVGMTPAVAAAPALLANSAVYFLQGTKIGDTTSHPAPLVFTGRMMTGAGEQAPDAADFHFVDYPATIGPFSHGGFRDPSWGVSVGRGIAALGEQPHRGDTVFGFSQGAVVATAYKRDHLGNGVNYVLVENPNRPNGGILERFHGLYVPLLNITFNGATPVVREPVEGSGTTVDIARQYDGWADFPAYPLNPLATANAVLGIIYLHGDTQDLGADAVAGIDKNDPRYYQQHGDTTYYVIPTKQLPLLMPLNGLLPKPVLAKLDAPLRNVVELGYDRSDYSKSVTAAAVPPIGAPATPNTVAHKATAGEATPKKTAKPARTSLPDKLRQSTAAISSTLRALTGRKSDPEPEKQQPKPSASEADKPDAA
ncbi:PE-PPE domain-containing protein [Mycobacterium hackensackense]|uniref:PE-PPE domain-containing protein n=1 Tax=Mycobacterium hackensackense TaxID=228909 RepID=UPI002265A26A|nr:PE-PPE domain-containing protein [Mycobacterium hackensackense]MCV7253212.1 PE-PPE domain-containing protein [Mycobacterium hackensackense]